MFDLILCVAVAVLSLLPAHATYVIDGQVQDSTGKPACGVRVCALAEDFDASKPNVPIPCSFSDPEGKFAITVDKPSRYKLVYDDSAHGHYATFQPFFRPPAATLPEVVVGENNVQASIILSMLPKNGLLVGKSVDTKTGLPVESVEFLMCHAANPEICWRTDAKLADGTFSVPTPHVPFTLRIKAAGFDDWIGPNGEAKETPINVAPETKAELSVFLKRAEAAEGKSISDTEKVAGVNLAAPNQLFPGSRTTFDHYPRRTTLQWSLVEGAASYSVEVDYCEGGRRDKTICVNPQRLKMTNNPPTSGIVGNSYEFSFVGAQPGRWRVWAVDKDGREGFKSEWRIFIYLR